MTNQNPGLIYIQEKLGQDKCFRTMACYLRLPQIFQDIWSPEGEQLNNVFCDFNSFSKVKK